MTTDVCKLIDYTFEKNKYGVPEKKESPKDVFCEVHSISRSEFFNGAQAGLKPELKFTIFRFDYSGETVLEYKGVRYVIYRTFNQDSDYTELYVQRAAGVQNDESDDTTG